MAMVRRGRAFGEVHPLGALGVGYQQRTRKLPAADRFTGTRMAREIGIHQLGTEHDTLRTHPLQGPRVDSRRPFHRPSTSPRLTLGGCGMSDRIWSIDDIVGLLDKSE
jgi:hypothetical protein